jgi:hypothetical protein
MACKGKGKIRAKNPAISPGVKIFSGISHSYKPRLNHNKQVYYRLQQTRLAITIELIGSILSKLGWDTKDFASTR